MWDVLWTQKMTQTCLKQWNFIFFSDPHSTHNLLICQLQVHFSQEQSPAYLRLFMGTIQGLWGPLEIKKRPKMGQNCMFWDESTLHLKVNSSILSLLFWSNDQIVCQVIWLNNKTWGDVWDVRRAKKNTKTSLQQWIFWVFFITTVLTTCLYANLKFTFLRNTHLHICVYSGWT